MLKSNELKKIKEISNFQGQANIIITTVLPNSSVKSNIEIRNYASIDISKLVQKPEQLWT